MDDTEPRWEVIFTETGPLAVGAGGGFELSFADEATAVELFRQWWHREQLARARREAVERRRARFRVVGP